MGNEIERRKAEHLRIAAKTESGFKAKTTLLEEVELLHCALPELAVSDIDLSADLFGKRLRSPLYFSGMTGGTRDARAINQSLARVAERRGIAFGLGSQRAMLRDPSLNSTYDVRSVAPRALVFANLGAVQAAALTPVEVKSLVENVGADALCIHLNPAQELIQSAGDRDFRGCVEAITKISREVGIPVIVKEVGAGISRGVAEMITAAGAKGIDVAGAGGTSWVGIEALRSANEDDRTLGKELWDWGIPTAACLLSIVDLPVTVMASGGLKTGLDIAKTLALGAAAAGVAGEALRALIDGGEEGLDRWLDKLERTLRAVMLLTGSRTIADLRRAPRVIGPRLQAFSSAMRGV